MSKHPPSHKLKTSIKGLGLIFILLLTLIGFTSVQLPEQFGPDDLGIFKSHTAVQLLPCLLMGESLLSFLYGIFVSILVLELLQSHIGEKRFSDIITEFNNLVDVHYSPTALSRAVFFAFCFDKVNRS